MGSFPIPAAGRGRDGLGLAQYLTGALPDRVDELLDDEVHALEARLLQLHHLLLHDGLEGQVWGEEPRPMGGTKSRDQEQFRDATLWMKVLTPALQRNGTGNAAWKWEGSALVHRGGVGAKQLYPIAINPFGMAAPPLASLHGCS